MSNQWKVMGLVIDIIGLSTGPAVNVNDSLITSIFIKN